MLFWYGLRKKKEIGKATFQGYIRIFLSWLKNAFRFFKYVLF